jgi:hypothetical protein
MNSIMVVQIGFALLLVMALISLLVLSLRR